MRKLCRVGLAAVLATALCVLTLVDIPPQLPEPPTDSPPTPGNKYAMFMQTHFWIYYRGVRGNMDHLRKLFKILANQESLENMLHKNISMFILKYLQGVKLIIKANTEFCPAIKKEKNGSDSPDSGVMGTIPRVTRANTLCTRVKKFSSRKTYQ